MVNPTPQEPKMIPLTRHSRLIVLAAVTSAVAAAASPAAADSLPSGCAQSGQTVTCSYAYNGGEQQFVVPAGVTSLHVDALGARGFSPNSYPGEVVSDVAVSPGQTLYVEVGGKGGWSSDAADTSPGGFNGGGAGDGGIVMSGGGGGGASDLRTCARADGSCDTLASRLVVAGGGGGLGGDSIGGNGGDPDGYAATNAGPYSHPGGGATQTAGGAGGGTFGEAGRFGQGGGSVTRFYVAYGGGGGGGGWYGGGSGEVGEYNSAPDQSQVGGGGGGSSHGPEGSVYSVHMNSQDPATVIVSYPMKAPDTTAPTFTVSAPQDGATYALGEKVVADYSCSDEQDGSGIDTCAGDVAPGEAIDTTTAGQHSFVLNAADKAGNKSTKTVTYTVKAADTTAPTIAITTPQDGATYTQGQRVLADYSCSDEPGGSGIDNCIGDADLHGPIDTATNGSHSFTVTATDAAGNRATKTVHYTVARPRADLAVAIGSSAASIQPGGALTQTVTVTNTGPSPARSITTIVTVPRGFTVTANGGGTIRNRMDRFTAPSLDSGASLTYTLVLTADPSASGKLTVEADSLAGTADPNLRNNAARDSVQIVRPQRRAR
jgi:uncharacterized repeat protein (TIGR01451 family)